MKTSTYAWGMGGNSAHNRWESFINQVAKLESLDISTKEAYMLCS